MAEEPTPRAGGKREPARQGDARPRDQEQREGGGGGAGGQEASRARMRGSATA